MASCHILLFLYFSIVLAGFVHLDLVDPEAGRDEESLAVLSSDRLEFMSNSLELKTDPDHYSKVDKVKYTKIKQSVAKDDTKKTEESAAQDWQGQDDIGELLYKGQQSLSLVMWFQILKCDLSNANY